MSDDDIDQQFNLNQDAEDTLDDASDEEGSGSFNSDWQGYRKYIERDSEEYKLLEALYIPSKFKQYVVQRKNVLRANPNFAGGLGSPNQENRERLISEQVSRDIETALVQTTNKVISKLDRSTPSESAQEALRDADYQAGPQVMLGRLESALAKLKGSDALKAKNDDERKNIS
jgi:hypothetical protein